MNWFNPKNPQTGSGNPPAAGKSGKPKIVVKFKLKDGSPVPKAVKKYLRMLR